MTLQQIGLRYGTDKATYHEFCDFYEQHLPDRNECVSLLEIGIKDGASLKMWRQFYFNPRSLICGIDINEPIRIDYSDIHILQGNAIDPSCLKELVESYPHFDIIIDDGSHMTSHQQITFGFFFPRMQSGDIYIIEDIHTSDWEQYRDTELTTEAFVRQLAIGCQIFIWHNEKRPGDSKTMLIIKP